jgi:hypothetical protein
MHLRKLTPVSEPERSRDEWLAERITAHFVAGAPFPNQHGFALEHDAPPPTVYGRAWRLEWGEDWCAHQLGSIFYDVSEIGEFSTAGAAAILVTRRYLRLMLGAGGPGKPQGFMLASRGEAHEGTHLDGLVWRFVELNDIGAGDLLILHHWKLKRLVLRVPWARSLAALIAGLKASERQPNALEDGVVTLRDRARLEDKNHRPERTLEAEAKNSRD